MDLFLKICTVKDIIELRNISIETFKESFGIDNSKENMGKYLISAFNLSKLENELNEQNSNFYFLFEKNDLCGYMKINEYDAQTELKYNYSLELERIYIKKKYQGNNYGQFLVNQFISIALERKKKTLWLGVWEKNFGAIKFYQRFGFIEFDKHDFYLGNDKQTDILMKLEL